MSSLNAKLKKIKAIVFDVDGTLTDGKIYLIEGDKEFKAFWSKDATRIKAAIREGIKVIFFTGRKAGATVRRGREMGADVLFKPDLIKEKTDLFDYLAKKYGVQRKEVLYVGDDWNDLYYMSKAGIRAAPQDGSEENKKRVDMVTKACGGNGVAAEVIEKLLKAQGRWNSAIDHYRKGPLL